MGHLPLCHKFSFSAHAAVTSVKSSATVFYVFVYIAMFVFYWSRLHPCHRFNYLMHNGSPVLSSFLICLSI